MNNLRLMEKIKNEKIIAIIRGATVQNIVSIVEALLEGEITMVEITFDHSRPNTISETTMMIKKVKEYFGDDIAVGAGTVLTEKEVIYAVESGAQYIISPNVNESVIKKTIEMDKISIPGALTPSEAIDAYEFGADFVKLFPLGEQGVDYIKLLMSPLKHIPFIAVGGVTSANVKTYLDIGIVGVGVGSDLVNAITMNNTSEITVSAKKIVSNSRL